VTSVSVKALRAASLVICLIVATSFLLFAIDQTSTASGHQQEELGSKAPVAHTTAGTTAHESGFRKGLDEVSEELTAPVAGLTSSASEWGERGLRLIFALLVYGFAFGYVARVIRVRTW
jgi:hypothetical protein